MLYVITTLVVEVGAGVLLFRYLKANEARGGRAGLYVMGALLGFTVLLGAVALLV